LNLLVGSNDAHQLSIPSIYLLAELAQIECCFPGMTNGGRHWVGMHVELGYFGIYEQTCTARVNHGVELQLQKLGGW
jgi:hypothetical protein